MVLKSQLNHGIFRSGAGPKAAAILAPGTQGRREAPAGPASPAHGGQATTALPPGIRTWRVIARPLCARQSASAGNRPQRGSCSRQGHRATTYTPRGPRASLTEHHPCGRPGHLQGHRLPARRDLVTETRTWGVLDQNVASSNVVNRSRPSESLERRGAIGYERLGDMGKRRRSRHVWAGGRDNFRSGAFRAPAAPVTRHSLTLETRWRCYPLPSISSSSFLHWSYNSAPSWKLPSSLGNQTKDFGPYPRCWNACGITVIVPDPQYFLLSPLGCEYWPWEMQERAFVVIERKKELANMEAKILSSPMACRLQII